jgi:hypothetical protein
MQHGAKPGDHGAERRTTLGNIKGSGKKEGEADSNGVRVAVFGM